MRKILHIIKKIEWDYIILVLLLISILTLFMITENKDAIPAILSGLVSSFIIYLLTVTIKSRINCKKNILSFKNEYGYIKKGCLVI